MGVPHNSLLLKTRCTNNYKESKQKKLGKLSSHDDKEENIRTLPPIFKKGYLVHKIGLPSLKVGLMCLKIQPFLCFQIDQQAMNIISAK
jgi:hypothetical protein